jgi:hypothetical protein
MECKNEVLNRKERNVGMMRLIKICQNMKKVLVVLFILMAVMSCDRAAVGPQDQMSQRCGCVEDKKAEKQRYILLKILPRNRRRILCVGLRKWKNTQLHRHIFPVAETKFLTNEE